MHRWEYLRASLLPIIIHRRAEVLTDAGLTNVTLPVRAYWINSIRELYIPVRFFIFAAAKQIGLGYIVPNGYYFLDIEIDSTMYKTNMLL